MKIILNYFRLYFGCEKLPNDIIFYNLKLNFRMNNPSSKAIPLKQYIR